MKKYEYTEVQDKIIDLKTLGQDGWESLSSRNI